MMDSGKAAILALLTFFFFGGFLIFAFFLFTKTYSAPASVSFTGSAFSPATVYVKPGETVTFTNNGGSQICVASDQHPSHGKCADLNFGTTCLDASPGREIAPGASATATMSTCGEGTKGYHNHNVPGQDGNVVVDGTSPSTPGTPSTSSPTTDTTPTWNWSASSDSLSGIDYYIFYWSQTSGGEDNSLNVGNTTSYTHSSSLPLGTWYAKVRAFDRSGNSSLSGNGSVVIESPPPPPPGTPPPPPPPPPPGAPPDTTAPNISRVLASEIIQTKAEITWITDEESDTFVDYGLTEGYGNTVGSANLTPSHSAALEGLASGSLYHFRVRSKDKSGNEAVSQDFTFTTLSFLPQLAIILINGYEVPLSASAVKVGRGSTLVLQGKNSANEEVSIYVLGKPYLADGVGGEEVLKDLAVFVLEEPLVYKTKSDEKGGWFYELNTSSLELGEYAVEVKTKTQGGKIEKAPVFSFNLVEKIEEEKKVSEEKKEGWGLWPFLAGGGFLALAIFFFLFKNKVPFLLR